MSTQAVSVNNVLQFPTPKPATKKTIRLRGHRVSYSPEQLRKFMTSARSYGVREFAMFSMSFAHGLRVSELTNLKLSDLRMESSQLQISRLKGSNSQLQPLTVLPGFDEREAILEWLKCRPEVDTPYLFVSRQSNGQTPFKLNRSQVYRLFSEIAERAGLSDLGKLGSHILRHSAAQLLYDGGADLNFVKEKLGHVSLSSSAVYAVPSQANVHEKFEAVVGKIFAREQD
jgi:type 1 fimbriae regulatory protein FimB